MGFHGSPDPIFPPFRPGMKLLHQAVTRVLHKGQVFGGDKLSAQRHFFLVIFQRDLSVKCTPPPPENSHDNGKSTIWRCISYWTWAFSNVMLVFRGVPEFGIFFGNSKKPWEKPLEWVFHQRWQSEVGLTFTGAWNSEIIATSAEVAPKGGFLEGKSPYFREI